MGLSLYCTNLERRKLRLLQLRHLSFMLHPQRLQLRLLNVHHLQGVLQLCLLLLDGRLDIVMGALCLSEPGLETRELLTTLIYSLAGLLPLLSQPLQTVLGVLHVEEYTILNAWAHKFPKTCYSLKNVC